MRHFGIILFAFSFFLLSVVVHVSAECANGYCCSGGVDCEMSCSSADGRECGGCEYGVDPGCLWITKTKNFQTCDLITTDSPPTCRPLDLNLSLACPDGYHHAGSCTFTTPTPRPGQPISTPGPTSASCSPGEWASCGSHGCNSCQSAQCNTSGNG